MTTEITDCSTGYDAVSTHYTDLSTYLTTGTGTPPDPTAAITALSYDNIITFSTQAVDTAPGHSIGAAVEVASEFYSLSRELDMANMNKVALIGAAASEAQDDANYHDQNSSFYSGVMAGQPTSGTRS